MRGIALFVLAATTILTLTGCMTPEEHLKNVHLKMIENGAISPELARSSAVGEGDINGARRLISAENVNAGCQYGMNQNQSCLLSSISFEEKIEVSKMLILEKNADVNIRGMDAGQMPIHSACGGLITKTSGQVQNVELCLLVIERGGNVNSISDFGITPLMIASINGFADSVKLLIANGANPLLKDKSGKTALDYANQYEHEETYQVIKAAINSQKSRK